ncbi:MAG: response regulator [Anaerolineae bacterium]|nr:response regulator [Anaerolineae bacterium]
MLHKIFLVEDEIIAREGIRDNVDWTAAGFEFCGEAPDGEIALPLIETTQPDVLITDIKMPFMDGLQLCKIVRERMPQVKVIILSGHDEFNYAQEAVKLGVTEYLLKPVGVRDLHNLLKKVALKIEQEKAEEEQLQQLKEQIAENRATLRERFLLKLVMGAISSSEAIEKSQMLEMDIVAKYYLVIIIKVELHGCTEGFDYYEYQQVQQIVSRLVGNNPDVFLLKKDMEELVLILKGHYVEYLEEEGYFLLELITHEINSKTKCTLTVGVGHPKKRIGDIYQSFVEALANAQNVIEEKGRLGPASEVDKTELLKLDKSVIENYLRCGTKDEFNDLFNAYIQPFSETALRSYLIKNYIFVDVVLTTAKFVKELNGSIDQIIPEINHIETLLMNIKTMDQIREQAQKILVSVLEFRDSQANNQYVEMIHQAKEYIDAHYSDPDISLSEVAARVSLSPSHFSAVFSQETGETFKEYLTQIRIKKAKELLRTTTLKTFEISYQIGYNDPHYFSHVFKKNTNVSPKKFRLQVQTA